ncbi:DNA/RNA helicase domain-containing protein, partial [Enterococcus faecium]
VVVAVFDENQILTTEQIWESADLAEMKLDAQCVISLRDQMRINAQQSTIDWIRSLVDEQVIYPFRKDDKYDFRVFDSPQEMYAA